MNSLKGLDEATILVVDDDPTFILALRKELSKIGRVIFATDGLTALNLIETDPPHVILLDVEMPKMDGFEVCQRLKSSDKTREIPIIFMTSHKESNFEEKVFDVGASDYISKPLNLKVAAARAKTHCFNKQALDRLKLLNKTDALTELSNRAALDERLEFEWQRAQRGKTWLSVLMIDIDEFKKYNDYFGHLSGDHCLKSIADLLKLSANRSIDMVARYGGEEFTIVLPETPFEGAQYLASTVLNAMHKAAIQHASSAERSTVTLSVGGAVCTPSGSMSLNTLLEEADRALYKAKNNGRDQFHIELVTN